MKESTNENLETLFQEMKQPTFKEYHIFFLGDISDVEIRKLASLDETDSIKNIQRIYCNYLAINENFFHCASESLSNPLISYNETSKTKYFDQMEEGLLSSILSLRVLPQVRYLRDNQDCLHLAQRVSKQISQIRNRVAREFTREPAVVLILERREDPLTPLGIDWSYQSLISELTEFVDNKVKVNNEEFNMNLIHDQFYKDNRFKNYGELANNLNTLMKKFSAQKDENKDLDNFEDMQRALHKMPEFKKQSANMKKHYSIVSEITKQVNSRDLLNLSRLEQEIMARDNTSAQFREAQQFMSDPKIHEFDKLRLASLFSLKYENSSQRESLVNSMIQNSQDKDEFSSLIEKLRRKCGRSSRILQRGTSNIGDRARNFYKDFFGVVLYNFINRRKTRIFMSSIFLLFQSWPEICLKIT